MTLLGIRTSTHLPALRASHESGRHENKQCHVCDITSNPIQQKHLTCSSCWQLRRLVSALDLFREVSS